MRKALVFLLSGLILIAAGTPYYSEIISAGTTPISTESRFSSGSVMVSATGASNNVRVIFSKDYLKGGDFEDQDYNARSRAYLDECALDGATTLNTSAPAPWRLLTGADVTTTCDPAITLHGDGLLTFTSAATQLVANEDMELVAADDFTSWTEAVNAGTGTITSEETEIHGGTTAAELLGGDAHVDLTSATITVTASTTYVLTVWGDVDATGDLLDIRVREATGGTDFLQANGTWGAGEVDFCAATFDDGTPDTAFAQCVIQFTTDSGITGITVSANVDVSADIGRVDDWNLTAQTSEILSQTTTQRLDGVDTDLYNLCFEHIESVTSSVLEFAIIDPEIYADDVALAPLYYTGSAWTTTETWIAVANAASATTVCQPFEARVGGDSEGNYVKVNFRVKSFGDEGTPTVKLDTIRLNKAARSTDLWVGTTPVVFDISEPGRFSVYAGSTQSVNFAALK